MGLLWVWRAPPILEFTHFQLSLKRFDREGSRFEGCPKGGVICLFVVVRLTQLLSFLGLSTETSLF